MPMNAKQQEMDKLWRELLEIGKELTKEALECKKRRSTTARYSKLMADERKLKAEYERVKGLGVFDSLSIKDGEKMRRLFWPDGVYLFLEDHPIPRLQGPNAGLRGRPVYPSICQLDREGMILVGWTPTQNDMFSSDWETEKGSPRT